MAEIFDIVIRGGTVLDGMGGPAVRADVGVRGEKVAAVGDLDTAQTGYVLDATGLRVAPGFVDIHTHSDISLPYDPGQGSALAMGVTTQITGNCGLSMALALPTDTFAFEQRWMEPHGARIEWHAFAEFHRQAEERGVATNVVPLVGHGTLRKRVMGVAERAPDAEEMAALKRELAEAFAAGAWGLSSGLEYPPSSYAEADELIELCGVAREWGGFYATHLRDEGDRLVEAVQEALYVTERVGLPLQLSHHKAEDAANWGKTVTTLGMIDAARARGQDVQTDQYPYTAFMTSLAVQTLPKWAVAGSPEDVAMRLSDPETRFRVASEIRAARPERQQTGPESFWARVQVGVCRARPETQGVTIEVLAREASTHPIEYVLQLLAETGGYVSAVNFAIGEEDIARVLRYPWTSIGSDGVGTHPGEEARRDLVHPRAYGTFARVLGRYVRELGVITEAEAIHKMTALPATRLGLLGRGLLAPGAFADVTIYDPATITDRATFAAPHQYAQGVCYVLVNGRVALENGLPLDGVRAGHVLRRN